MEGPTCTGCNNIIDEGSVIAFGESLFHLKCFICAKCSEPVDCDSNLLLLSNGRPVCESCSYCCNACKQAIRDEAIMTGDEAYHADCFRCVSCKKRIEDLVFTQTSKGIHCTPCHEKRRAKKQKRREEREKRSQFKQQGKELPSIPPNEAPQLQMLSSRSPPLGNKSDNLFDEKIVNGYMQQSNKRSPIDTRRRPSTDPPTPSRSRSNSVEIPPKMRLLADTRLTPSRSEVLSSTKSPTNSSNISPNSPPLSIKPINQSNSTSSLTQSTSSTTLDDMPSLNLSFFENESTDLANLTKKLGANIALEVFEDKHKTTENITRASQLLEYSLMMSDEDYDQFPQPPLPQDNSETDHLRAELEIANSKLVAMQASYNKIKDASRKALDELSRAKEEFSKEVTLRQQQEYIILQLKHQLHIAYVSRSHSRAEVASMTKEEIERVARLRVELDKTCNELKSYRQVLVMDIESLARQKQNELEVNPISHLEEHQKALTTEIKSLQLDRDHMRKDNKSLEFIRDEILHEMVMLNTKNAELTEMNNSLSRRMTEREREAAAVMAGTSFLSASPSPSLSSERPQQPKVFKLKKKGNMFSKLTKNKVDTTNAATTLYGHGNLTTSSTLNLSKQSSESTHQHGSHTFLQTSFLRPTKCDACGEKMWGLSELRCQGCMYATHARCLPQVPQLCYGGQTTTSLELASPSSSMDESGAKLLGGDLSDRAKFEDRPIPLIIEKCIQAVEQRGMDYEGIYRKSGGAAQVRLILQSFMNGGEPIDLEDEEYINDICAVTSVLKQYFRELPNPLLPYHLYSQFIEAVSNQDGVNTKDKFDELLSQLPKAHYETLKLLIQHLYSVQERHDENLMTTKNLAMVFGPTLLRDIESSRDLVDMSYKNAVVEYLILNVNELF